LGCLEEEEEACVVKRVTEPWSSNELASCACAQMSEAISPAVGPVCVCVCVCVYVCMCVCAYRLQETNVSDHTTQGHTHTKIKKNEKKTLTHTNKNTHMQL